SINGKFSTLPLVTVKSETHVPNTLNLPLMSGIQTLRSGSSLSTTCAHDKAYNLLSLLITKHPRVPWLRHSFFGNIARPCSYWILTNQMSLECSIRSKGRHPSAPVFPVLVCLIPQVVQAPQVVDHAPQVVDHVPQAVDHVPQQLRANLFGHFRAFLELGFELLCDCLLHTDLDLKHHLLHGNDEALRSPARLFHVVNHFGDVTQNLPNQPLVRHRLQNFDLRIHSGLIIEQLVTPFIFMYLNNIIGGITSHTADLDPDPRGANSGPRFILEGAGVHQLSLHVTAIKYSRKNCDYDLNHETHTDNPSEPRVQACEALLEIVHPGVDSV
ncbi:hypothetical protein MAR_010972, partial [Mya arenaria]